MSDKVKVAIRLRPLLEHETREGLDTCWKITDRKIQSIDTSDPRCNEVYTFDRIYDCTSRNGNIYQELVAPLVTSSLDGYNCTIFVYGQSGSGKTHTMYGTKRDQGFIPRVVDNIFSTIALNEKLKFLLRVAYIEICNGKIYDLLNKEAGEIKIQVDANGNMIIAAKEIVTSFKKQVYALLKMGKSNRQVRQTTTVVGQSHTIFRLIIESTPVYGSEETVTQVSHLNLVDLAGSEKVIETIKTSSKKAQSMSTLALVMSQLSGVKNFTNYRDSNLTLLLKNSLGGNANTLIICNVTPASVETTHSTLLFAKRAKTIKNKPIVNISKSKKTLVFQCELQIQKLTEEMDKVLDQHHELLIDRELARSIVVELTERINLHKRVYAKAGREHSTPSRRRRAVEQMPAISEHLESILNKEVYDSLTPFAKFEEELLITARRKLHKSEDELMLYEAELPTLSPEFDQKCLTLQEDEVQYVDEVDVEEEIIDDQQDSDTPDTTLRERAELAEEDCKALKEFTMIESIVLSQETDEDVKKDVINLKKSFDKVNIQNAQQQKEIIELKKELDQKCVEIDDRIATQNKLNEQLTDAKERIKQLEEQCKNLEMKKSICSEKLWGQYENMGVKYLQVKKELEASEENVKEADYINDVLRARLNSLEGRLGVLKEEEEEDQTVVLKKQLLDQDAKIAELSVRYSKRVEDLLSQLRKYGSKLTEDETKPKQEAVVSPTVRQPLEPTPSTSKAVVGPQPIFRYPVGTQTEVKLMDIKALEEKLRKAEDWTTKLQNLNILYCNEIYINQSLIRDLYDSSHSSNMTAAERNKEIRYLNSQLKMLWEHDQQPDYKKIDKRIKELTDENKTLIEVVEELEGNIEDYKIKAPSTRYKAKLKMLQTRYDIDIRKLEREKIRILRKFRALENKIKQSPLSDEILGDIEHEEEEEHEVVPVESAANIKKLKNLEEFYVNYYSSKVETVMANLKGIDHPAIGKVISSLQKHKSETNVTLEDYCKVTYTSVMKKSASSPNIHHIEDIKISTQEKDISDEIDHEKELQNMKCQNQEIKDKFKDLQKELTVANDKITELTTDCQRFQDDIKDLQSTKAKLEKLNWSLDNRVESLFNEKETAVKDLEVLKKKCDRYYDKIDTPDKTDRQNTVLKQEYDELFTKYNKMQLELSEKIVLLEQLSSKVEKREPSMQSTLVDGSSVVVKEERPVEKELITITSPENEVLKQKLHNVEYELQQIKKQEDSLLREKETLIKMLEDSFRNKMKMESEMTELKEVNKDLKSKIEKLHEQFKSDSDLMKKEKTNTQQTIFDLKAQQSSIDTQMDYIRRERESILKIRKEFETKLKTLTDSNNTLLLDKKLLEEENDRLSKQNDALTSENTSLVGKINVKSEESDHVQDKILNNNSLIEELNETVENLTDERNNLKTLIETYSEKMIIIENTNNLLEKEKVVIETKLEFTIADNKKLNEKYTARISFLEDEVNALIAEKYLVESKLHIVEADHQKSNETFAIRINFLEDENKALAAHRRKMETRLAATEQDLTIEKSAHLKSLQSLEIDRQKMADELTLQNNILQAENNVLGSQIKSRIEDIIKEKKYANELKNELASQNEMVKNLQTENTNNSEDLKNLKTELELKRNEVLKHIENITNARLELEETSKKLETHRKEVRDLKSKLKAAEATPAKATACESCSKLRTQLVELEAKLLSITGQEQSTDSLEYFRTHCDYQTKRIKELENENKEMKKQVTQQSAEHQILVDLKAESELLKTKYFKLKSLARMRLNEIEGLKSRLPYTSPSRGPSTSSQ